MKRLATLAALLVAAFAAPAQARFVDGFLAQCSATAAASCTESVVAGYGRQPIAFSTPVRGLSVNATPWNFGPGGFGLVAGHAVYDAPTGGNLLEVLPLAVPVTFSSSSADAGDVAALSLTYTPLIPYFDGAAFSAVFAPAAVLGTTSDGSTVTTGSGLVMERAITTALQALNSPGVYRLAVQVAGFSVVLPNGVNTYVVTGAGTLATGAIALPLAPYDGQLLQLACGVTVTALTVTPSAGQTLSGSVTTCGPSAGHQWVYAGGTTKTWFMLGS